MRHQLNVLVQASNISLMKNSMKLVWDFGTLQAALSKTGMTTGNPRAFSSSVYSQPNTVTSAAAPAHRLMQQGILQFQPILPLAW